MFGGRYLRQRTALGSESTALQTETTLGLPTGQKRRICGKNVINLLIFGFFLTFLAINLQADLWRILGISLVFFTFFFFFKIKDSADFFVCNFPTLFCRKFAGRPVADPRYFFGFSHTFFGVKIKVSADRFFVVVGIPTLFGRFTARVFCCCWFSHTLWQIYSQSCGEFSVFHWFFEAQNPTHAERTSLPRKKTKKKQTGKPRLNLTRSLQQGNSR